MMSGTGALSTERLSGLMASVGSDSHLEWLGMNTSVYGGARRAGLVQPLTLLLGHSGVKLNAMIDEYLSYLMDVRRMSPNTVESYARDLALLANFADQRSSTVGELQRQDLE